MPTISEKGNLMPQSPIRKLVPFAEEAESKGKTVFYLNIGQPDIKTPTVAFDALMIMDRRNISYSHSAGGANYRKGLSKYYKSVGIDVTDKEMLVTTGGSEALIFSFLSTLNPGDEIIIPEPFYANYNAFATYAGVTIKAVTAKIENGFALPPIDHFEALITDKTKGIVICNPANPTGYLYTEEELLRLKEIVKKYDLFLYADEVYREFCYDGATPFSVMNLTGIEQNVILIDSVSKRYSMCGARIGALITRNKEVIDTAMKFAQARLAPPTLGQVVSEAALKTPQSYFDEVISTYVERRNVLVEALNKIEGVFCPLPKGAFYCVARLPVDNTEKFCQWMLQNFEHEGKTVMLAPLSGFYASEGEGTNEVRLAYVLEKEALLQAVECIAKGLEKYPGRLELSGSTESQKNLK
ncbi:MAG: pyridoxal phosphate-dependent aminotransferase [Crocinitomicaceae bacterium]